MPVFHIQKMKRKMKRYNIHGIFLGTGTSQGIPVIGCNCAVCISKNPRDQRLRTAFYLNVDGVNFVIDTGPDFRQQMLANKITKLDAVLVTHEHKDHLAGLDDIRPFNFMNFTAMPIFAEHRVADVIRKEFSYVFVEHKYPGVPMMDLHEITNEPFDFKGITIQPLRVLHMELPIYGFRIGQFAYITDASNIPEETMKLLEGVEVLVINTLRYKPHYSHFCVSQSLEIVEKLKPKQAYFTHMSHDIGLYDEVYKTFPENVHLGYDGLQIDC